MFTPSSHQNQLLHSVSCHSAQRKPLSGPRRQQVLQRLSSPGPANFKSKIPKVRLEFGLLGIPSGPPQAEATTAAGYPGSVHGRTAAESWRLDHTSHTSGFVRFGSLGCLGRPLVERDRLSSNKADVIWLPGLFTFCAQAFCVGHGKVGNPGLGCGLGVCTEHN